MSNDWFCPKCNDFVSPESVTFHERHQVCDCPVYVPEEPPPCPHCAEKDATIAAKDALLQRCVERIKSLEALSFAPGESLMSAQLIEEIEVNIERSA